MTTDPNLRAWFTRDPISPLGEAPPTTADLWICDTAPHRDAGIFFGKLRIGSLREDEAAVLGLPWPKPGECVEVTRPAAVPQLVGVVRRLVEVLTNRVPPSDAEALAVVAEAIDTRSILPSAPNAGALDRGASARRYGRPVRFQPLMRRTRRSRCLARGGSQHGSTQIP